jgi:hypothetical protein
MNKRLLLSVTLCTSLAACAGAPPKPVSSHLVDVQKVASVNLWAETKGARVLWVNYPSLDSAQQTE